LIKISARGIDELWQEYQTTDILHAVDALDEMRGIMSDDGIKPPEIRDNLLKLHEFAHELLNEGFQLTDEQSEEFCELLDEVKSEIYYLQERLEKIDAAITPLEKLFYYDEGDDYDDYDDEEE